MRINEFTATDDLEEAPVGMMKRAAQGIGSKVLNKIPGAGNKAANLAGKADLSDTANNLYKEFSKFIGTQGKNIKQATGEELDAFLKSKKAVVQGIPSGVLTKPQINDVLMKAAKDAMAKQAGAAIAQPGQATAPVDANKDGKDDKTGKPIPKQKAQTPVKIPANLQKKINALNPKQKQELAALL